MNSFNKLIEIFSEFPGIGPRQAKRFVYFLVAKPPAYAKDLIRAIENLKNNTLTCNSCFRIFSKNGGDASLCSICADRNRDTSMLAVVSRDSDLESIEKSGSYNGLYFVLGGIVPILEVAPDKKIRSKELLAEVGKRFTGGLKEIILAMSANADSENTAQYVEKLLSVYKEKGLKISLLGRGLSTGTELEYSDADTLRNALSNRK
ncbi:MAG: toprim domain-containing protein [Patescibacteria group bacterium]